MNKSENNTLVLIVIIMTIIGGVPTGIVSGFIALCVMTVKKKIQMRKYYSEKVTPIRHCRRKERKARAN